jgi:two-component system response regulator AtoC
MRVLVVEDDLATRRGLEQLLETFELEVKSVPTLAEAQAALGTFLPDVCLTDLKLPDGDGIDFIRIARANAANRDIVVLTGHGSVDTAVEAMKAGAIDYLLKPLRPAQLESVFERLRQNRDVVKETEDLFARLGETGRFGAMVGQSPAMQEMCRVISRIAKSDAPVMITGESGSGKEAAALTIHQMSRRRGKPFVAINCGAVSTTLIESELFGHEKGSFTGAEKRRIGYFELAQGGTLLLDEVTEMSMELQVKFLRVLETRTFRRVGGNEELNSDVRIISSSNRDLEEAIREKKLREDLYYRLNVFPLHVAPLRERREDIPLLAAYFLEQVEERERGGTRNFSGPARDRLVAHGWPGNVRELRNVVYRAYVLTDGPSIDERIVASVLGGRTSGVFPVAAPVSPAASEEAPAREPDLPAAANAFEAAPAPRREEDPTLVAVHVGDSLEEVEKRLLQRTLEVVGGNKKKAAELLKISLKTVYNKVKQYGLEP